MMINKDKIIKDPQFLYKYTPYLNQFDFSKINFPVKIDDTEKVGKIINCGINVFGYEGYVYTLQKTNKEYIKTGNYKNLLLIIGLNSNKKNTQHYIYIKHFDAFVNPKNDHDIDGIHRNKKRHIRINCYHWFSHLSY